MTPLAPDAWQTLLTEAHTHHGWTDRPVEAATLKQLYELLRWAPTALNCQPLRIVFVQSAAAKERLRPAVDAGNLEKTMAAPVTAILAFDQQFYDKLGKLVPHWPGADQKIAGLPEPAREAMARQSGNLQAGYLILAARGLGLDCGPMGGFNKTAVDAEFFADGRYKSLLLVNLGYGDADKIRPRAPRLDFDEACTIA